MGSSSPRARRLHPAPRSERTVLTSTWLLNMTRFAVRAIIHKPVPMPVLEPLMCKPTGPVSSHHQRQRIPRKIPRAPQVLSRAAACTRRDARTLRRHPAARCDHRHPHLLLSNLRGPCRSQPHDGRLRDRAASSSLWVLLCRLLLCCYFSSIRASMSLLRRLHAHSQSSGAGVCVAGGHGAPLYKFLDLQRRQQRRYAERSNARDPPTKPACRHIPAPPLSLPATHESPAGAGRCGRRRRATPRERRPSPASRCRHRRARWRGHAAVALRPHVRPRGPGECGGRPRSSSCAIMCVFQSLSVMKK